jgi:tetratricopeptide (TPR) repeat protein
VTALIVFSLASHSFLFAADRAISGVLLFENRDFNCEMQCRVTLVVSMRPVDTVLADLGGHFRFNAVPRAGSYALRIEIDGFETYTYSIRDVDPFSVNVVVPLVRKSGASPETTSYVVDVSEFLQRYPKKAVSSFEKGSELSKKNKNEDAIKYFRDAVELAPTFYEAHYRLGVAYRTAGRLDDAEQEFLKAHELNSTAVNPLLHLVSLYLDENDTARAVSAGEQAVKANSRSASAFFSFGVALYRDAQLDRAEVALKRALDLAPKFGKIRLMLANVYLKLRRYDNTIEQLNTYIAENPRGEQLQDALTMRDQLQQARAAQEP